MTCVVSSLGPIDDLIVIQYQYLVVISLVNTDC